MKKPLLEITDIPNAFDISRYGTCASWKLADWAAALTERWLLRNRWSFANQLEESEYSRETINNLKETARKFLKNPLPEASNALFLRPKKTPVRDQSAFEYLDHPDLGHPNISEWITRYAHAKSEAYTVDHNGVYKANSERVRGLLPEIQKVHETPAWQMLREVSANDKCIFVAVDLKAPDDLLVSEFKTLLKRVRKNIGAAPIRRQFNKSDFTRWHEQALLPYQDLTFWAQTEQKRIPQAVLGETLFPDEANIALDEHIRKTIAPNSQLLVSEEIVATLAAQLQASLPK